MTEIKSCPFMFFAFGDPGERKCIGEDCINFDWGEVYREDWGFCAHFSQSTGHVRITEGSEVSSEDRCWACGSIGDHPSLGGHYWPCGTMKCADIRGDVCYETETSRLKELLKAKFRF